MQAGLPNAIYNWLFSAFMIYYKADYYNIKLLYYRNFWRYLIMSKWLLKKNKANIRKMSDVLGISPVLANILANRGIGTGLAASKFMSCPIDALYPPEQMLDMDRACGIIAGGIAEGKKIAVYGDYDVDGVMSSSILYKALRACGGKAEAYIPHRQKDGYGLNINAVEQMAASGVNIIITCDNGITAIAEVEEAKALGMQVVVIDHHEPLFEGEDRREILPCADAVVDPKRRNCRYPYKKLCAAGISYKFAMRLFNIMDCQNELGDELLVLASIATVCDIVDLTDENRIIVKNGLKKLKETSNIGLNALIDAVELRDKEISEYHLGFIIGPCINAAGRLEAASMALELFTTEDNERAKELAIKIIELNESRKALTREAENIAVEVIESEGLAEDRVLVVYSPDINESVAGIAAGRIKERYYRPVIIITGEGEIVKGSGRSIEGYNIFEELLKCSELFVRFGGHPMAAGLSLDRGNVDELRKRLNAACMLTEDELIPKLRLEQRLSIEEASLALADSIKELAPFGKENPLPLFGDKSIYINKIRLVGSNKNIMSLSLFSHITKERIRAVDFDNCNKFYNDVKNLFGEEKCDIIFNEGKCGVYADIVFYPTVNRYMGRDNLQLVIKDIRLSNIDQEV